jgi:hypothetical protein
VPYHGTRIRQDTSKLESYSLCGAFPFRIYYGGTQLYIRDEALAVRAVKIISHSTTGNLLLRYEDYVHQYLPCSILPAREVRFWYHLTDDRTVGESLAGNYVRLLLSFNRVGLSISQVVQRQPVYNHESMRNHVYTIAND